MPVSGLAEPSCAQIKVSKMHPEAIYLQEGKTNNLLRFNDSLDYVSKVGNGTYEEGDGICNFTFS